MALNIKNERVHALAREVAARTGQTQTSVIEQALAELLARLGDTEDVRRAKDEELRQILDDFDKRHASGPPLMRIEDLYDERGLPA